MLPGNTMAPFLTFRAFYIFMKLSKIKIKMSKYPIMWKVYFQNVHQNCLLKMNMSGMDVLIKIVMVIFFSLQRTT